jgi:hypothetical protein
MVYEISLCDRLFRWLRAVGVEVFGTGKRHWEWENSAVRQTTDRRRHRQNHLIRAAPCEQAQ